MIPLARRLEIAMEKRGIRKKADIARACKVSTASVADWFNGNTKTLKADTARLAAEFFGCSRDWIGSGIGDPGWTDEASSPVPQDSDAAKAASRAERWRVVADYYAELCARDGLRLEPEVFLKLVDAAMEFIDERASAREAERAAEDVFKKLWPLIQRGERHASA